MSDLAAQWLARARSYRRVAAIVAPNHPDEAMRYRDAARRIIAGIREWGVA